MVERASAFVPSPKSTVRRHADRAAYDRATVYAVLDEAWVAHVGFVHQGAPVVIPSAFVRVDGAIYLHGAQANRMLGALAAGGPLCVTVTLLDGLVLARSFMHHSVNYRSVVVHGRAREVSDPEEKARVLTALIERVRAGRSREARPANELELRATRVLEVPLVEVSAKARSGPPLDDAEDLAHPCWAGVIPLALREGEPIPHVLDAR